MVKKICILGPESTGKSLLSSLLAKNFKTQFAPEFGRVYLEKTKAPYTQNEVVYIGQQQAKIEVELLQNPNTSLNKFIFFDTGMWTMKVWFEWVYNTCPTFVLDAITHLNYDAYLLCYPNLPWIPDGIRECQDPHKRLEIYNCYLDIVVNTNKPFLIVNDLKDRFKQALQFLTHNFSEPNLPQIEL